MCGVLHLLRCLIAGGLTGQVWCQSETLSIKKSNNIGGSGALHHAWHCTVRTGHHHHQGTWMWFAAHWSSLHHHWSHLMRVRGLEGLRRGRWGRRVLGGGAGSAKCWNRLTTISRALHRKWKSFSSDWFENWEKQIGLLPSSRVLISQPARSGLARMIP